MTGLRSPDAHAIQSTGERPPTAHRTGLIRQEPPALGRASTVDEPGSVVGATEATGAAGSFAAQAGCGSRGRCARRCRCRRCGCGRGYGYGHRSRSGCGRRFGCGSRLWWCGRRCWCRWWGVGAGMAAGRDTDGDPASLAAYCPLAGFNDRDRRSTDHNQDGQCDDHRLAGSQRWRLRSTPLFPASRVVRSDGSLTAHRRPFRRLGRVGKVGFLARSALMETASR